ncbi:hypothetical protein Dip518_000119 [Parelusimicrobium proximum]|uniref:hypothetical protein n=1 Tax=Parelusimicrobium proximum TaxID=3228953 RepID=UPI003D16B723
MKKIMTLVVLACVLASASLFAQDYDNRALVGKVNLALKREEAKQSKKIKRVYNTNQSINSFVQEFITKTKEQNPKRTALRLFKNEIERPRPGYEINHDFGFFNIKDGTMGPHDKKSVCSFDVHIQEDYLKQTHTYHMNEADSYGDFRIHGYPVEEVTIIVTTPSMLDPEARACKYLGVFNMSSKYEFGKTKKYEQEYYAPTFEFDVVASNKSKEEKVRIGINPIFRKTSGAIQMHVDPITFSMATDEGLTDAFIMFGESPE